VRVLEILAELSEDRRKGAHIPASEAASALFIQTDDAGLPIALKEILVSQEGVLTAAAVAQVDHFKKLLRESKEAADQAEQDKLIEATIDPEKLDSFRHEVIRTWRGSYRLRSVLIKADAFDQSHAQPRSKVPSLGFNQLDDKGPFVKEARSSYVGWGESYGRGLARAEDREGFKTLLDGNDASISSSRRELYTTIEQAVRKNEITNAVILHSLLSRFDMTDQDGPNRFVAKYQKDCPPTPFSNTPSFSGVLKIGDKNVPVISMFVDDDTRGKVLVANLKSYCRWVQFPPADDLGEENFVTDAVLIRVKDLNRDDELRAKILENDPQWLQKEKNKERYLQSRVVVNVYEKFTLTIIDPQAAVTIAVSTDKLG
jgi:hypothetical protein